RPAAGASGVEGGVASLVLLSVDAPGARREAKVAEIVASQKVYEFLPAKMTIKLRNAGNVHVAPSGTMFIKQGSKQVGALNFNVERGNILPGTNRTFEMSWNDGFPVFEEKTEGSKTTRSLKWNLSNLDKLRFGRYTANLVAVYDDGQRDVPVEAVVSFWVIPWRILGVLLLIILLVGFGTWALLRFVWKNVRRQVAAVPVESEPDPSSLAAATKKPKKNHRNERHEELKTDENNEDASPDAAYRKPVVETERRSSPGQPDSQQPRQQKASTPKKSQKALTANDTNRPSKAKHNKRKRNHKQRRRHE
ncbi:MAG: hypothetical protein JWP13_806, partial [Candidatus Saccharibacteria bacterium]|nr:hypothetical protein [Candidatus Saccharibacteria bacterium]